ncbi:MULTISPECIES: hypothetical protein [Streptomyces]|uniref:Uncharacterized protein n=2 Tax=Streptomyces TaxID=1883 RepID=A0ABU4KDM8_9ACTN|nr:hypothetical protein [Streptomyces roseolus]MDX2295873.1 hypothetical protein [Streptomyces roseolus]
MSTTSPGPYDWSTDAGSGLPGGPMTGSDLPGGAMPAAPDARTMPRARTAPPMPSQQPQPQSAPAGPSRATRAAEAVGTAVGSAVGAAAGSFIPPVSLTYAPNNGGGRGNNGGGNGGGQGPAAAPGAGDRHQGDRMIYMIERIELRSDRDIVALCKAINRLGRELHLILGMRAEEVQGVLSTYKGAWYTFGASSKVRARLVAAHLRVAAEAAKALGVAALKTAHAFDRHFVAPEREAKQRARGKSAPKKQFTIGDV